MRKYKENNKKQTIIPPEGGWDNQCYYLVEVCWNDHNPIYRAVFYSGFKDAKGNPGAYAGIVETDFDGDSPINTFSNLRYLKAIRQLTTKTDMEVDGTTMVENRENPKVYEVWLGEDIGDHKILCDIHTDRNEAVHRCRSVEKGGYSWEVAFIEEGQSVNYEEMGIIFRERAKDLGIL